MNTLHHASYQKDLEVLTPQKTFSKDKYIGDFVFATEDKLLALMHLASKKHYALLESNKTPPRLIICGSPEEYQQQNISGAIYVVNADDFEKTPQQELNETEMVSQKIVKPIAKNIYDSPIESLKEMGVEVRFVTKEELDTIIRENDR